MVMDKKGQEETKTKTNIKIKNENYTKTNNAHKTKTSYKVMIKWSNTAKIEYSFRINFGETQNKSEIDHRWGENFQDAKWQM